MSQSELARRAKTSRQQILKIETRRIWERGLPYDWAQRLAVPLQISPIELMTDSDADGLFAELARDWVHLPDAEKRNLVTYARIRLDMLSHAMAAKVERTQSSPAARRRPKRQRK
jgi:transcriptional regulator with XRE-family HTH domain